MVKLGVGMMGIKRDTDPHSFRISTAKFQHRAWAHPHSSPLSPLSDRLKSLPLHADTDASKKLSARVFQRQLSAGTR